MGKDKIRITVTVSTKTKEAIEKIANKQDRSISYVGGKILDERVQPINAGRK